MTTPQTTYPRGENFIRPLRRIMTKWSSKFCGTEFNEGKGHPKKPKKKKMEQPNPLCWSTTTLRTLDRSRRDTNKTNAKHTAKEAYTNTANKPKKQNKKRVESPPQKKNQTSTKKSKVKEQKP